MTTEATVAPDQAEGALTGFFEILVPDFLTFFRDMLMGDPGIATIRLRDFVEAWCWPEMERRQGAGWAEFSCLQETLTAVYGARHGARPLLMHVTAADVYGRHQLSFEIGLPHQPADAAVDECQLPTRLFYCWASADFIAQLRTALGHNNVLLSVGANLTVTTVLDRPAPQ